MESCPVSSSSSCPQLSPLVELGERVFRQPLLITEIGRSSMDMPDGCWLDDRAG